MRVVLLSILILACLFLLSCDDKSVDNNLVHATTGDINGNGVAYDISDAVMFLRFFIVGESAFGDHVAASIAASDCNRDGIKLGVADYVCLVRAMMGDASLLSSPPEFVPATYTDYNGVLNIDRDMGAALIVCEGTNVSATGVGNVSVEKGVINGNTHIFVTGFSPSGWVYGPFEGDFLRINGDILWSEYATPLGDRVDMRNRTYSLVVYQNDPNPFSSVTKIKVDNPNHGPWLVTICNSAGRHVANYSGLGGYRIEIDWDASNLPPGFYFYTVEADGKSITKKALLQRGD